MNTERIQLNMTPDDADKIAHILMASLGKPNFMLDSERKVASEAARILFSMLGYGYTCDEQGNRVELARNGLCEHPGVFATSGRTTEYCPRCRNYIPISFL